MANPPAKATQERSRLQVLSPRHDLLQPLGRHLLRKGSQAFSLPLGHRGGLSRLSHLGEPVVGRFRDHHGVHDGKGEVCIRFPPGQLGSGSCQTRPHSRASDAPCQLVVLRTQTGGWHIAPRTPRKGRRELGQPPADPRSQPTARPARRYSAARADAYPHVTGRSNGKPTPTDADRGERGCLRRAAAFPRGAQTDPGSPTYDPYAKPYAPTDAAARKLCTRISNRLVDETRARRRRGRARQGSRQVGRPPRSRSWHGAPPPVSARSAPRASAPNTRASRCSEHSTAPPVIAKLSCATSPSASALTSRSPRMLRGGRAGRRRGAGGRRNRGRGRRRGSLRRRTRPPQPQQPRPPRHDQPAHTSPALDARCARGMTTEAKPEKDSQKSEALRTPPKQAKTLQEKAGPTPGRDHPARQGERALRRARDRELRRPD